MKKSFAIVLSAFILLATTSCDLQKIRTRKCQKWGVCTQNDSTGTSIKDNTYEKDSLTGYDSVSTDAAEFYSRLILDCDSTNKVVIKENDSLKADKANYSMSMHGDTLIQRIFIPAKTVYVPKYMKVRSHYVDVSKESVKTVTIKVNELKWHQAARLWAFNIILIVAILLFGWKMLKLYIYKKLP